MEILGMTQKQEIQSAMKKHYQVEIVYEIEVPKSKTERKKLVDEIIGDNNFPEQIHYYYKSGDSDEPMPRRDPTFSYDDFVNYSIEEL